MHFETPLEYLESRTYDEINTGDSSSLVRTLRPEDVKLFALMSGDMNPALANADFRHSGLFQDFIAHGMWTASLLSTTLGTQFPGPGTVLIESTLHFARPVTIGDTVTVTVTVRQKFDRNHHIILDCACVNQDQLLVVSGSAEVLAPTEKIRTKRVAMPEITISDKYARLQVLVAARRRSGADRHGGGAPVRPRIAQGRAAGRRSESDRADPHRAGAEDSGRRRGERLRPQAAPHRQCQAQPRGGGDGGHPDPQRRRRGLMKGSLHTDELMAEVISRSAGLRTERRISHVFLMDVPTYPRPIMITDAAINIEPTLQDKVDIIQNAIDLAHIIGTPEPKVAILSAVETVSPKIQSTLDAAALCKMADRGQIRGGLLDGPLAFDNAVSLVAAKTKGITSAVAGRADILVVPDLESGNMIAKQLEYLANALSAGIVLGARVPIVLTSRADTAETRIASCVIAALIAHSQPRPSERQA
jgi:phosphate acetyltransferase